MSIVFLTTDLPPFPLTHTHSHTGERRQHPTSHHAPADGRGIRLEEQKPMVAEEDSGSATTTGQDHVWR